MSYPVHCCAGCSIIIFTVWNVNRNGLYKSNSKFNFIWRNTIFHVVLLLLSLCLKDYIVKMHALVSYTFLKPHPKVLLCLPLVSQQFHEESNFSVCPLFATERKYSQRVDLMCESLMVRFIPNLLFDTIRATKMAWLTQLKEISGICSPLPAPTYNVKS